MAKISLPQENILSLWEILWDNNLSLSDVEKKCLEMLVKTDWLISQLEKGVLVQTTVSWKKRVFNPKDFLSSINDENSIDKELRNISSISVWFSSEEIALVQLYLKYKFSEIFWDITLSWESSNLKNSLLKYLGSKKFKSDSTRKYKHLPKPDLSDHKMYAQNNRQITRDDSWEIPYSPKLPQMVADSFRDKRMLKNYPPQQPPQESKLDWLAPDILAQIPDKVKAAVRKEEAKPKPKPWELVPVRWKHMSFAPDTFPIEWKDPKSQTHSAWEKSDKVKKSVDAGRDSTLLKLEYSKDFIRKHESEIRLILDNLKQDNEQIADIFEGKLFTDILWDVMSPRNALDTVINLQSMINEGLWNKHQIVVDGMFWKQTLKGLKNYKIRK